MANSGKFVISGQLDLSTGQARRQLRNLANELKRIKGLSQSSVITSGTKSAAFVSGDKQAVELAKQKVELFNQQAEAQAKYASQVDKANAKLRSSAEQYKKLIAEMREYNRLLGVQGYKNMNPYELSRAYTAMGEDFNLNSSLEEQSRAAAKARSNLERYIQVLNEEEKELNAVSKAQQRLNAQMARSMTSKFKPTPYTPANLGMGSTYAGVSSAIRQYTGNAERAAVATTRFNKGLSSLGKSVRNISLSLTLYHGLSMAMQTIGDIAKQTITLSAELDHVRTGMEQLESTSGAALGTISRQMKEASQGTLSLVEAMKYTSTAFMLGGDSLVGNLPELFDIARVSARALGIDAQRAMESLTTGIGRQSARWLDNLGIIIDTRKAYKDLAAELGTVSSQLSEQQQIQAIVNEITDKYGSIAEANGAKERTYAEDIQYMKKSWEDFLSTLSTKGGIIDDTAIALGNLLSKWAEYNETSNNVSQAKSELVPFNSYFQARKAVIDYSDSIGLTREEFNKLMYAADRYVVKINKVTQDAIKYNLSLEATRSQIALVDKEYEDLLLTLGREDIVKAAKAQMRPDFRFPLGGIALKNILGPLTKEDGGKINRELEQKFQSSIETALNSALEKSKIDKAKYFELMAQLNDIPTIYSQDKNEAQQFAEYVDKYAELKRIIEEVTQAKTFLDEQKFQATDDIVNANKELSKYKDQLDNLEIPDKLFAFKGFGASFSNAKRSLQDVLSSSAPVETKVAAIKGFLDRWTPAINNATNALNAMKSISDGIAGSINSALASIATKVSKDAFMDYYQQAEDIKRQNEGIALSSTNVGEAMWETANNADPFLSMLKEIASDAPAATKTMSDLASSIQNDVVAAMTSGMEVKPWDFLDGYQDASFEMVRKLQDVANKGSGSEFFKSMIWDGTIPPEIAAQGEQAIKAYSQKLVAEGKNLEHPEWLNTDALVREVQQQLQAKANREQTIKLGVDAVIAAGLYSSQGDAEKAVKQALGIPNAGAYIDGVQQGLKDGKVGLKTAQTFLKEVSNNEKEYKKVGKSMAQKMWAGLQEWVEQQSLTIPTTLAGCNASITNDGVLP